MQRAETYKAAQSSQHSNLAYSKYMYVTLMVILKVFALFIFYSLGLHYYFSRIPVADLKPQLPEDSMLRLYNVIVGDITMTIATQSMTITCWMECLEAECNFFDIKAFEVNYNIRHSMRHIHQIHHDINPSWMNDTQAWMDAIHFYSSNLYFNLLPNNWTWVPSQASLSSSSIRIFLCLIFISNISYFHFHSNIFTYIHHIHRHSSILCLPWMKCK
jgi:hypothetical protein